MNTYAPNVSTRKLGKYKELKILNGMISERIFWNNLFYVRLEMRDALKSILNKFYINFLHIFLVKGMWKITTLSDQLLPEIALLRIVGKFFTPKAGLIVNNSELS